jgi:hypothetical protein
LGRNPKSLLAVLLLAIAGLALTAVPAGADPPTATVDSISNVSYASARINGTVYGAGETYWRIDVSTDGENWAENVATGGPVASETHITPDVTGLKGGTKYFVRIGLFRADTGESGLSAEPNPEFTTLAVEPPTVASIANASEVAYTTAKASGQVERPANPDPAFDAECRFEYIPAADFGSRNEEQSLTIEATGGSFALGYFDTGLTPRLDFNASASSVQAALQALPEFGPGNVSVTGGPGGASPYVITFTGALANKDIRQLELESSFLTGIATGQVATIAEGHLEGWDGAGRADCEPNPVKNPTGATPVTANLTGLANGTVYRLRLVAFNDGGSDSKEAAQPFTTLTVTPPSVSIDPIVTFTDTTAHFSGEINPSGTDPAFETSWHFQCTPECPGLSGGPPIAPGGLGQQVEDNSTGLEPNTAYEVELIATNAGGQEADQAFFHTTAVGPVVQTFPAFALEGGTEVLVGGKLNPKNSPTTYWVEYGAGPGGPSPTYSDSIPASKDASAGSGGQTIFVTPKISGLSPGATYHYRLVAKNAIGESKGEDVDFETSPSPATPPASCPNAKLRTETNSAALPECRAYEMTTAPDKNGADVNGAMTTSPDGNRVGYISSTGFGDSPANNVINSFMAQRGASGWTTRSMEPPFGTPGRAGLSGAYSAPDFSSDLSKAVGINRTAAAEPAILNIFLNGDDGSTRWVTEPTLSGAALADKGYAGRSADASHIVFESEQAFTDESNGTGGIWEWVNGQVRFVGNGHVGSGSNTSATLGTVYSGTLPEPTAVSADGRRIFISGGISALSVYEEGVGTRDLALSQRTGSIGQPAPGVVTFAGAAVDGSRVYIAAESQLTDDATPGGGLYSYNLETDVLSFIGPGGAQLISADGTRVYFNSSEQLVPGQGVAGGNNLYTADDEGNHVAFVATVGGGLSDIKATPDGSHLVFDSAARLTAFDNAGHPEVYLYGTGDGLLRCASCGPDGHIANGDAALIGGAQGRPRGISDDGGSVFFQTSDGLVPEDVNGLADVYEYRDGQVILISAGTSKYDSRIVDNSPDGKNVFFITRDSLVGQDIDGGAADVYDARVNGGFPAPVAPVACEGENCQGQGHAPPAFASPGTASLSGKGNPAGRSKQSGHSSCKKKSKKQRSRCGSQATKHRQTKKHQAKKTSKSGRGK